MSPDSPLHNKQQRKKARRKDRKQRERQAHRNLDEVTSQAITQALVAAQRITAPDSGDRMVTLDVDLASRSEAQFVRKRVNDALNVDEWLADVRVVILDDDDDVELKIEKVRRPD